MLKLRNLGKKEKVELTITGISVIFLISLLVGNIGRSQAKKRLMVRTGKTIASSMSEPLSLETYEEEISRIKGSWGRDPFSLGTSTGFGVGLEGLVLNGIVWDKEDPYAIINSDIVKAGDSIRGMKILEIGEEYVILEEDGKRYTLRLKVF